jgi:hypothetical protein
VKFSDEESRVDLEGGGEFHDVLETDVSFAAFDAANIGPVKLGHLG